MSESLPEGSRNHPGAAALTERDRAILDFERNWNGPAGAKEQAIRESFGFSAPRYYQILGELIKKPAALRYDPMLINRLVRLRFARAETREARALRKPDHR